MAVTNQLVAQQQQHTTAWFVQAWAAFIISVCATTIGVINLPAEGNNAWVKGYLGIGLLFTVSSSFTLAKTVRDIQEAKKLTARVDEARVERLLADHHPLK
ncbi:hypothetical protein H6F43_05840 [Leptolyngbya sp. FACHB-36]|uniref:YiaA/YiaB family inner membrane protein n=1 Tax=Leptolyngbya sp. FACHB-36 TaxID=2692808 RepID=UPI001680D0E8|nr:YiaA/YiaB family inner membrane protein [Leptolyngbya sp. FACHB-36]MBD2019709.1 hypothetical protein [Leptolyngbya sp. FACHB-36]